MYGVLTFFFCFRVLVVEDLNKDREPLPTMDGLYLITPSEKSIATLIKDFSFSGKAMYRNAHVYFTEGKIFHLYLYIKVQLLPLLLE